MLEEQLRQYYAIRLQQTELDKEAERLRADIMEHLDREGAAEVLAGEFKASVISAEQREYDDRLVYETIPDPELWKLVSKVDAGKVKSLVQLGVLSDDGLRGTYRIKSVRRLSVKKR